MLTEEEQRNWDAIVQEQLGPILAEEAAAKAAEKQRKLDAKARAKAIKQANDITNKGCATIVVSIIAVPFGVVAIVLVSLVKMMTGLNTRGSRTRRRRR